MRVTPTAIPDVLLIEPKIFSDGRGYFFEGYNERLLSEAGIPTHFVQDNYSHSVRNVLRGLHYQQEHAQGKLVRVTHGEIFDVAVDIRPNSATFGSWVGMTLKAKDHAMLWIPQGFAHGFSVLSATADVVYKVTDFYSPAHERTLLWNDAAIGIRWPLSGAPILSGKDQQGHTLNEMRVSLAA